MLKKRIFFVLCILFLALSCLQKEVKNQNRNSTISNENHERIDCNYYWPARNIHVCIKDMPIFECESLFSSGQFLREEHCFCDKNHREKNFIKGQSYIQYDCK